MNEPTESKIPEADIQEVQQELSQLCNLVDMAISVRGNDIIIRRIEDVIGRLSQHLYALGLAVETSHQEQGLALQVIAYDIACRVRLLSQPHLDSQATSQTLDQITGVLEILEGVH